MRHHYARLFVFACLTFVAARPAHAEGFTFDLTGVTLLPGTGQAIVNAYSPQANAAGQGNQLASQIEAQITPQLQSIATQLRADVNDVLAPLNFANFVHNTANASAMAAKAMPVDYAAAFRIFSLSVGGGGILGDTRYRDEVRHPKRTFDAISNSQAPNVGGAPDASVNLGISLGAFRVPHWRYFDLRKVQLFVSGFKLSLGGGGHDWQVRTQTWGGYAKYQIMRERAIASRYLFHWHGLNVLTGLGYSSHALTVNASLPASSVTQQVTVQNQTLNINAGWNESATMNLRMRSWVIPIEVTSALQLLYAVTLYGGAALDFNIGRAELTGSAQAPVTIDAGQAGNSQTVTVSRPTASLTYALARNAKPVDVRGFAGVQINAGVLGLFAQVSGDSTHAGGVHAGLRGFW